MKPHRGGVFEHNLLTAMLNNSCCYKVIVKTKNYKKIWDGNHSARMRFKRDAVACNIKFFHYHIRNYDAFIERTQRWAATAEGIVKDGYGTHELFYIELYKAGKLKEYYDNLYSEQNRKFLMEQGCVVVDKSVPNFLKHIGLL